MKQYPNTETSFLQRLRSSCCHPILVLFLINSPSLAQPPVSTGETMEVGVARVDITPEGPIRLAGYGLRAKTESDGVLQPLEAKALAFGNDAQGASVLITVDWWGFHGTSLQN